MDRAAVRRPQQEQSQEQEQQQGIPVLLRHVFKSWQSRKQPLVYGAAAGAYKKTIAIHSRPPPH
ncbi:MAG: hypothetical protein GWP17_01775 [Aquificales bacterium]|nr:hypothetical protein [Aquificales bacterium]